MTNKTFQHKRPEQSPGFLLWQVTVSWQRQIKIALEPLGFTHPQFVICALLLWFGEQNIKPTQMHIIEESKLDKMTVSLSLKKLAEKGLISRQESSDDARAKIVRITPKGKNITKKAIQVVEQIDQTYFSVLKCTDKTCFMALLTQLV